MDIIERAARIALPISPALSLIFGGATWGITGSQNLGLWVFWLTICIPLVISAALLGKGE